MKIKYKIKTITIITSHATVEAESRDRAVLEVHDVLDKFTFSLPIINNDVQHQIWIKEE